MNEKTTQHIFTINQPDVDCFDLDAMESVLYEQSVNELYKRAVKILEDLGCTFNLMDFMTDKSDGYVSTYTTYKRKDECYAITACFLPDGDMMTMVSCCIELLD